MNFLTICVIVNLGVKDVIHLLKIVVSGYKMLEDNFVVDFRTIAKITDELEPEVYEVDENLHAFNIVAYTGSNASGKTTVLRLIYHCLKLMQTGRWIYSKNDFSADKIKLYLEFYKEGIIYLYESEIYPCNRDYITEQYNEFCKIKNEKIKIASYKPYVGKNYASKLSFKEENAESGIEDTSSLQFWCKEDIFVDYMSAYSAAYITDRFFANLNSYSIEMISSIIKLMDDSIEYIKYTPEGMVLFKRLDELEVVLSKTELLNLLSNGTIKGIDLYIRIITAIKKGGYFIIDEIENCFHKNLVDNILFLFNDKKINHKNSKIIFATHYVEILDTINRRDNINILHKIDGRIRSSNLYTVYKLRTEILKSKQFNNNTFNTLLNYERLMKLKRMIKNEVSHND